VATLAAAFEDDPLFAWLVPDRRRRAAWLRGFMRASLRLVAGRAEVLTLGAGAAGEGGAGPPPERLPTVLVVVGAGRYPPPRRRQLAFALGLLGRALLGTPRPGRGRRALRVARAMERAHWPSPHLYLLQVGVDPSCQGRGLGRRALEYLVTRARAEGVPAYLETSNADNLGFYRRFGFEVVEELRVADVPPVWTMVYRP